MATQVPLDGPTSMHTLLVLSDVWILWTWVRIMMVLIEEERGGFDQMHCINVWIYKFYIYIYVIHIKIYKCINF